MAAYGETLHEFVTHLNRALLREQFELILAPELYSRLEREIDALLVDGYKVVAYLHGHWHNAVIFTKEGGHYVVLDPKNGLLRIDGPQLRREMRAPWLFTFMAVRKATR